MTFDPSSWRALLVFASYRLMLAILLFSVFYFDLPPQFLGSSNPQLYLLLTEIYIAAAVLLLAFTARKWGGLVAQTKAQLVIDIVLLTLIIDSSGGLSSGLGLLLVVVVVAGGALIPGRLAAFIAAMATLALLIEAGHSQVTGDDVAAYSRAGMLGATFFVTALLAQLLAKKIQTTQVLAEQRARDVAKLAVLNQHIISRMQVGVLVLDEHCMVTMLNESAQNLLGISKGDGELALKNKVPTLAEQIVRWQHHNSQPFEPFQARSDLPEVRARATKLDSGEILIYLENTSAFAQQTQQLKLASLGRLTASIAHEIRNPLGAISHAGELLAENYHKDADITKLTAIIQRHSSRVNSIIETILHTSRRKTVAPTMLVLMPWLDKLSKEYCDIKHISHDRIKLEAATSLANVWIDPEQLHQVLWNLLENAWHYCQKQSASAPITLSLAMRDNEVIIDVIDNGPGISAKVREQLFEPFHSERQGGTGLGLYLARELCQANGARLNYLAEEKSCCFRISLSLKRKEVIH